MIRFLAFAAIFCATSAAYAGGCDLLKLDLGSPELNDQATVKRIARAVRPKSPDEFVVHGIFSKKTNLPFAHEREFDEHLDFTSDRKNWGTEIRGNVAYEYFNEIIFTGERLEGEKFVPFETSKTIMTIYNLEDRYFQRVPELNKPVITKMQKLRPDSVSYRVFGVVCDGNPTLPERLKQDVIHCINDPTCK